jgi:hypothetical protein
VGLWFGSIAISQCDVKTNAKDAEKNAKDAKKPFAILHYTCCEKALTPKATARTEARRWLGGRPGREADFSTAPLT